MSPNEDYVLKALNADIRGVIKEGDDPPDGIIEIGEKKIAVEVSRLVERVIGEDGAQHPRLAHDRPAEQLANEIEVSIGDSIPDGIFVFLTLSAPLKNIRKTRLLIASAIGEIVQTNKDSVDLTIFGNAISISVCREWKRKGNKIASTIVNPYSSANISENAAEMLRERIETKNEIRKRYVREDTSEYWLALYNGYWVADTDTYRASYRKMNIAHGFNKIFIVNAYGQAHSLW